MLEEFGRRGFAIVEEPGRQLVRQKLQNGGSAFPWVDSAAFLRRAADLSLADREAASRMKGWVFFDRGLVDAAAGLEHVTGDAVLAPLARLHPYHRRAFLVPPWPEIYVTDAERRHGFDKATADYDRILSAYAFLGYELIVLPKTSVSERADLILTELSSPSGPAAW